MSKAPTHRTWNESTNVSPSCSALGIWTTSLSCDQCSRRYRYRYNFRFLILLIDHGPQLRAAHVIPSVIFIMDQMEMDDVGRLALDSGLWVDAVANSTWHSLGDIQATFWHNGSQTTVASISS